MAFERFHYTTTTGGTIELPKFDQVPAGLMRRLRKQNEMEQMFGIFEGLVERELMTEDSLTAFDDMGMGEVETMVKAWQKDAGITAGESSAS